VLGGVGTILVVLLWSWLFPPLRRVDGLVPEPATNRQAVEASSTGD
jgi:hypothetical protein